MIAVITHYSGSVNGVVDPTPVQAEGKSNEYRDPGTGKVGFALGARLASVGHHVVYGSRTPTDGAGTVSQREAMAVSRIRSTESR